MGAGGATAPEDAWQSHGGCLNRDMPRRRKDTYSLPRCRASDITRQLAEIRRGWETKRQLSSCDMPQGMCRTRRLHMAAHMISLGVKIK